MGLKTAISEVLTGQAAPEEERTLTEALERANLSAEILKENLTRLELAQEDSGWRRQSLETEREFTRAGLDDIAMLSRSMYLSHPLINRAVNVTSFYTFGQGMTVNADDENVQKTVVDKTMNDDGNIAELFGHTAQLLSEVDQMVYGNVFFVLYTDSRGDVEIRSFPLGQIKEIFCKEGDRMPAYYRRRWSEVVFDEKKGRRVTKQREALYPDWRYHPRQKKDKIGDWDVEWDAPIMHQKTGGMKDMLFGVPETYAALDWARAYRKFLENWATIIASLSKFAWQFETKGREIANAKKKLGSTIPENDEGIEENDQPAGQAMVVKKGDKLTPIPKSGAATSAEDGRQMRLMVASALNIPDTMLANDPQQGALATAQTLDRPTELYIRSRQTMWAELHKNIFRYVIDRKIEEGLLPGDEVWNERKGSMEFIPKDGLDDIEISFPPILEHDMESTVRAIVTAATLEGRVDAGTIPKEQTTELLLEVLGVKDIPEAVELLAQQTESELEEKVKELGEQLALSGVNNPNDPNNPEKDPEEGED